ncbi:3-oxoacyl-ACP reductase FabG [Wenzhouxiangella marina]|uniref:3-oxoacyl-[acyl-carrier-protein] reductase n=1 Tax=Wenzhouxiangella marina TaxID=1579979 RepID=A0A0K0XWE8_9GAMM|nr:3-oxoacyl-ACP reductase FabG [Wenzhouxiangella marina]AKS41941.1 3-ketoacyl-ACP reductase [Wenzhouxiangella marina]MBB6086292.1 3-oxoacyl-[acyl-carrier protein] reductase [Wenzhouxiangella marina]
MEFENAQRIDGQVVLVTGASRGIGQATAEWLSRMGGQVFGTATSQAGADAISERLGEGRGLVLDVTDGDAVQATIAAVNEQAGPITVLVNNAAITRDQLLMRLKDEDWEAVLDTNLTGAMRMTRACLRGMLKARGGRIINVSSVVGYAGNPGQGNYCAAKAGLAGFSRAIAHEVGSRGITCNVVAPGFIDTDMTRALDEQQRERLTGTIPLGRLGEPEDVAACVGFLASPASAYVSGQTLHVNGGMYMT